MRGAISIGGRRIGPGERVYVVAELSASHEGSFEQAAAIVRAAAAAGADAVKLQTYTPETMTLRSGKGSFRLHGGTAWDGRTLYDLYDEAQTPWEWHGELKRLAEEHGMALFSSPFDATAVDFLETLNVPAYKIASFELVDLPLVRKAAATRKPLVLSTGMATEDEIADAVDTAVNAGASGIALLKCTSAYPAPPAEMNLRTIVEMRERFGVPVGLSDHSTGIVAPVAAVSLGAVLIEKHLAISRASGGPDSGFSLEPGEFAEMVAAIREAEAALGRVRYGAEGAEATSRKYRRSLYVVRDVRAGAVLTDEDVRSIRPGDGLPPKHLDTIIGRRAARGLRRGTPLSWDDLAE